MKLFEGLSIHHVFVQRREAMETECSQVSDDEILRSDLLVIADRIAQKYHFDVPEAPAGEVTSSKPIFARGSNKGAVTWFIPIRGDGTLLACFDGSNKPMFGPTLDLKNHHLELTVSLEKERVAIARNELEAVLKTIKSYLPNTQKFMREFNDRFRQFAHAVLKARYDELKENEQAENTFAQLGFPLQKHQDAAAKVFFPIERKVLSLPQTVWEDDQFLQMEAYEGILEIIRSMALGIERSPETFKGMDEEDIRIVLLIGLNAIYGGNATGDTFHGKGKTDIHISVGNQTIFIAECLIWEGEKKFRERKMQAQLFDSYLMWRDTKTALIIFNRNKDMTEVVKTMREVVSGHPQCIRNLGMDRETESRYLFRQASDSHKHFYLNAFAFNVPS